MITKAIFPVAGLGSRFLPATKALPKEMLPIIDKPLIQYAVDEAIAAGITELIFVTSSYKRAIEDHFDRDLTLESRLSAREDTAKLEVLQDILPQGINCIYIRQSEPLGLGHAILCAKNIIGNDPFAVLLADDLLVNNNGPLCLAQMITEFSKTDNNSNIIAVERIASCDSTKYGIVQLKDNAENSVLQTITSIIEKPQPKHAPSNLGAVGRYILMPSIFAELEQTDVGSGNEIQLTDAICAAISKVSSYSYEFAGARFDCGTKLGYLKAIMHHGLEREEFATDLRDLFSKY